MVRNEEPVGWAFGPFELDADGELRRDGARVPLSAKPLALLRHLLAHAGRTLPRDELLAVAWPGVHVSQSAYHSAVRDLRRALGDPAEVSRYLETRRGRGLRWAAEARRLAPAGGGTAWHELAFHFERALEALDQVVASRGDPPEGRAPRERSALLVALGRARWAAGATAEARSAFAAAAESARRFGDAEMFAQAALGFAGRSDVKPAPSAEAVALLEEALDRLPDGDGALACEVLARLGTELYHEADGAHALELTARAAEMAERLADPALLSYALTSRHYAMRRPTIAPEARIALCNRAEALASEAPASDVLALALQELTFDLLELGDGEAFARALERYGRAIEPLDQPFYGFMFGILETTRLLLAGRLDEAEAAALAMFERGRDIGSPNAEAAYAAELYAIREAQGRLAELAPLVEGMARGESTLPIVQIALIALAEASGDAAHAGRELERWVQGELDALPRDENWLGSLAVLAPVAARHGGEPAARLRGRMAPCSGRLVVGGHGALVLGAVDHHLGQLAAAEGDLGAARRHLEDGLALHRRLRAPIWTRRSEEALATLGG